MQLGYLVQHILRNVFKDVGWNWSARVLLRAQASMFSVINCDLNILFKRGRAPIVIVRTNLRKHWELANLCIALVRLGGIVRFINGMLFDLYIMAQIRTRSGNIVFVALESFCLLSVHVFLRFVMAYLLSPFILVLISARSHHPSRLAFFDIACAVFYLHWLLFDWTIPQFFERQSFVFWIVRSIIVEVISRSEMTHLLLMRFIWSNKSGLKRSEFLFSIVLSLVRITFTSECGIVVESTVLAWSRWLQLLIFKFLSALLALTR